MSAEAQSDVKMNRLFVQEFFPRMLAKAIRYLILMPSGVVTEAKEVDVLC